MKKLIILLSFLMSYSANSQILTVFGLESWAFPNVKAKFYAVDSSITPLKNISISDFLVTDPDTVSITSVTCPAPQTPTPISSLLTIDISSSMASYGPRIDFAKEAAKLWVKSLKMPSSQCAINSFNHLSYLNSDFTTNKTQLNSSINSLATSGGTNYNEAFLDPLTGSIKIAQKGTNKRVIVFLTDGVPSVPTDVNTIIAQAQASGITIHCVALGMGIPGDLRMIADKTNGTYFELLNTMDELLAAYVAILLQSQNIEPCEIEWVANGCKLQRAAFIGMPKLPSQPSEIEKYSIRPDQIAHLNFSPSMSIDFGTDIVPPNIKDTTITITAKLGDMDINSMVSTNSRFTIEDYGGTPPPFVLPLNQSRTLTVRFKPIGIGYTAATIKDTANKCSNLYISLSAGLPNDTISDDGPKLQIDFPDGGEKLMSCSDSIIRWSGVLPQDSVTIEFSSNNGASWNIIVEKTTGLEYAWHIPDMIGANCLIRAKYIPKNYIDGRDTNFTLGEASFSSLSISPDRTKIAVGTSEGKIVIIDKTSGAILNKWDAVKAGRSFPIEKIDWSPAGDKIAYITLILPNDSSGVGIMNASTGEFMHYVSMSIGTSSLSLLKWSNSGERLAYTTNSNFTYIHDSTGARIYMLKEQLQPITSISWKNDGTRFATGSGDSTIVLWDMATGLPANLPIVVDVPFTALAFCRGSQNLAYATSTELKIINPITMATIRSIPYPNDYVAYGIVPAEVLWSHDCSKIAMYSHADPTFIQIYSASTGDSIGRIDLPLYKYKEGGSTFLLNPAVNNIFYQSLDNEMIVGFTSSKILICNTNTNKIKRAINTFDSEINSLCFNPDGSQIAVGYWDYIKIWDVASRTVTRTIDNQYDRISSVEWSPKGNLLAATSAFNDIKIWDPSTGVLVKLIPDLLLNGNYDRHSSKLCWNDDGSNLITFSDTEIQFYEAPSMKLLKEITAGEIVRSLKMSPNNKYIRVSIVNPMGELHMRILDVANKAVLTSYETFMDHQPGWNQKSDGIFITFRTDKINLSEFGVNGGNPTLNLALSGRELYTIDLYRPLNLLAANSTTEFQFYKAKNLQLLKTIVPGNEIQCNMIRWCQDSTKLLAASGMQNGIVNLHYLPMLQKPIVYDTCNAVFSIEKPLMASRNISMGQLLVNDTKDTTFIKLITNSSRYNILIDSIRIAGTDAKDFGITSPAMPVAIPANSSIDVEFSFHPTTLGTKNATIEIFRQCDTLKKNMQGISVQSSILVLNKIIDFGKVKIGTNKDSLQAVTIKNISNKEVEISLIKHGLPNDYDFTTLAGGEKVRLQPGDTIRMDLRFAPSSLGRTNGTLEFHFADFGSPAIVQLFGEGVSAEIQLIHNEIDFGSVLVGDQKDSLQAVTIANVGTGTLTISNLVFSNPMFSEINGKSNFSLAAGDTARLDLRFLPTAEGAINGSLEFHHSNPGSPAIISLRGIGIKQAASFQASIAPFDTLICDNTLTKQISIKNTGSEILEISELNISGTNSAEFAISQALPLSINSNDTKTIDVVFQPIGNGPKTAQVEIVSNAQPNSYIIPLIAHRETIDFAPTQLSIDLGILCANEPATRKIRINNNGSISGSGRVKLSSLLQANETNFAINSNDFIELDVTYIGAANSTPIAETITIIDSICGFEKVINITGTIDAIDLLANDLTVIAQVGNSKQGTITITNNSLRDVSISSVAQIAAPFELTPGQLPIIIKTGKSEDLNIIFTPSDNQIVNQTIQLLGEPCSFVKNIKLTGTNASAIAEISVNDISAYAGYEIEVPIILTNKENLDVAGVSSLETELEFNPTLLYPIGYSIVPIDAKRAKIIIKDLSPTVAKGSALTIVKFIAALGNAVDCPLLLTNTRAIGATIELKINSGKFTLLGICDEGGTRLVNSAKYGNLLNVSPNPSSGNISVELNLFEKGATKLTVSSQLGKLIFSQELNDATGNIHLDINSDEFANGVYFVSVQTPTLRKTVQVLIVR